MYKGRGRAMCGTSSSIFISMKIREDKKVHPINIGEVFYEILCRPLHTLYAMLRVFKAGLLWY